MSSVCNLRNFCIFQGVQPPEYLNCGPSKPQCSQDADEDDGTFICDHHLTLYFKIGKMAFQIPSSGGGPPFTMLVGKTLLQQNSEIRIMIPTKDNYETHLKVDMMSATEKFVFYNIYDEPEFTAQGQPGKIRALCESLRGQEFYTEDVLSDLYSIVAQLKGRVNPAIYCRPIIEESTRNYNAVFPGAPEELAQGTQQAVYDAMPVFIKNLIDRLVRPVTLTVTNIEASYPFNLALVPTCDLEVGKGLTAPSLYNPDKPRPYNRFGLTREPKFQIRVLYDFEGRASRVQRALANLEVYKVSRPLLLGTETVVTAT
jgi:Baculovirus major capsid protein VP39